ncbi:hypothetical protein ABFX02_13G076000 [Erythranthe guttata]
MEVKEQCSRNYPEQSELSIDRLSDLPDSVICHILSFLPTKFSVRTSILGQRWRFLWSYVPNLYFHLENQGIINRVMLLRRARTINAFHLDRGTEWSAYQLQTWITFAVMRGVQRLNLCLQDEETFPEHNLPVSLFTCKTLVDLRLRNCALIPASGAAVCLPRLKILHLVYVEFEADESLPHLLSGCPVLEEFEMALLCDMVCCGLSSPTIKRLTLDFIAEGFGGRPERLEIHTPALEYLNLKAYFNDHFKCGALTSLIAAEIILVNYAVLDFPPLLKFFDRLCNVKSLTLDLSDCSEIIDSVLTAWATRFRNLTNLNLTGDCRFLSKLLENADNLEMLTFSQQFCELEEGWTEEPQQVPRCLLLHLRIIKLEGIVGKSHEFEYIGYLLRNAKVLERMEISYSVSVGSEEKIDMLEKILRFKRGSTACEVNFVGSNCKW